MIHFDRFGWRFTGASSWTLRDVSLRICRGEFVAVTGASGSGKTTLGLAMCGLLIGRHDGVTSGDVHVAEQDVATTALHQVSQTITLVQQNPETHFATLTVRDEIAFGMENRCLDRSEILQRSAEALDLLSIAHLRDRSLATLSGGEQQRVAVASIVAGKPDVIVLDEPTASLDPQASCDLFHSLADLCRKGGLTVVIIEHKLAQLLPLGPRLIHLEEGQIAGDKPGEALGSQALYGQNGAGVVGAQRQVRGHDGGWHGQAQRRHADPGTVDMPAPTAQVCHPDAGDPVLEMSQVTVELGTSTILRDVNLRVRAGEIVAVMGPNGGGKTTLLHALLGLVTLARGSIRVCGQEVSPVSAARLAGKVGMVFQNADHQLIAPTVNQEALFAARTLRLATDMIKREAEQRLEQAGLADRKEDHPYRLSWGQKRRLNLISAILHNPTLLLLDEPFAGQDWANVSFMLDIIEEAGERGAACVMVTHDPRAVLRGCTRVLFISQGQVSVDAPVAQAFEQLTEMGHQAYVPGRAEAGNEV